MINNQDWVEAYKELCTLIKAGVSEIKHIDLWYDQISYELEEYPYPEKSVFMEFGMEQMQTNGLRVQDMITDIKFIFAMDTLADSFDGSENQAIALEFGETMRKIHGVLQAASGNHFGSLDRVSLKREPAPERVIAYSQTYRCIIRDYAAMVETTTGDMQEANVTGEVSEGVPPEAADLALFVVDL